MNDRELLEDAAKAAGYKKYYAQHLGRDSFVTYDDECYNEVKERRVIVEKTLDWNPLIDDGDAFRLAVRLGLHVFQSKHYVRCGRKTIDMPIEETKQDPLAATRRAIVRAAAKIGRSMK